MQYARQPPRPTVQPRRERRRAANVLCEYGPTGLRLSDAFDESVELSPDSIGDTQMLQLGGYINVRVTSPVLAEGHRCPLVLMSRVSHQADHFTRLSLAQDLAEAVGYMLGRPDAYRLGCGHTLGGLALRRIIYNARDGIFEADIAVLR